MGNKFKRLPTIIAESIHEVGPNPQACDKIKYGLPELVPTTA